MFLSIDSRVALLSMLDELAELRREEEELEEEELEKQREEEEEEEEIRYINAFIDEIRSVIKISECDISDDDIYDYIVSNDVYIDDYNPNWVIEYFNALHIKRSIQYGTIYKLLASEGVSARAVPQELYDEYFTKNNIHALADIDLPDLKKYILAQKDVDKWAKAYIVDLETEGDDLREFIQQYGYLSADWGEHITLKR